MATTKLFADVNPEDESSFPFFQFFFLNGKVFFTADDGDSPDGDRDLFVIEASEIVLPLQLVRFGLTGLDEAVKINWATENEKNVHHFEIERSSDGTSFEKIGQLSGKGNASQATYDWLDQKAYQQKSTRLYYRLKMVDNDGKFSYSSVIFIKLGQVDATLSLYPNPVKNDLRISFMGEKAGKMEGRVISATGQVIQKLSFTAQPGNNQQWVSTSNLPAGIYFLELKLDAEATQTKRFIKQ
jgi:hypothetical protein